MGALALEFANKLTAGDDVALYRFYDLLLGRARRQIQFRIKGVQVEDVMVRRFSGRAGAYVSDLVVAILALTGAVRELLLFGNTFSEFQQRLSQTKP